MHGRAAGTNAKVQITAIGNQIETGGPFASQPKIRLVEQLRTPIFEIVEMGFISSTSKRVEGVRPRLLQGFQ